jgi:hypothetical protein
MMGRVRIAGQMIYRTQILMMVLVLIVAAWMAAGEIYEAAIQIPGHGESAALVLVGLNVLCSWLLVFNLAAVLHDVRELRLPQQRQLLSVGGILIFVFVVVLPCALVWSLNGAARDVFMIAVGAAFGSAGAALWRRRLRARSAPAEWAAVAAGVHSGQVQIPSPWRAVRVALGPPFAPTSWQRRAVQAALLCVMIASAPILTLLYERSPNPPIVTWLLYTGEFLGFLVAISFCWAWPVSRLLAILSPQSGAPTELALLPGLGSATQQLRRLLLVALGLPFAGLMLLLVAALVLASLQHTQHGIYLKLILEFLVIPLITLPFLAGQLNQPQKAGAWSGLILISSQTWTVLVWSSIWNLGTVRTAAGHQLAMLAGGLVLIVVILIVGFSTYSLRKFLRRPHPFVEGAS